jgi:dihydrofolate synthase
MKPTDGRDTRPSVLFAGPRPDVVLLTEASIAGGNSRGTPASSLKELWIAAARDRGIDYTDAGTVSGAETPECIGNLAAASSGSGKPMLIGCQDLPPFKCDLIKVACELLESRGAAPGLVCVTGSLHLAASVLQQLGPH